MIFELPCTYSIVVELNKNIHLYTYKYVPSSQYLIYMYIYNEIRKCIFLDQYINTAFKEWGQYFHLLLGKNLKNNSGSFGRFFHDIVPHEQTLFNT